VLNTFSKTQSSGFSLIELLIAVAVLTILVSLAVPGMKIWLQNAQIRNAAESIQNGLQRARSEAVVRNMNVEFVLSGTDANCVTGKTCSSWKVWDAPSHTLIDSRDNKEGSADVKRATLPAGATIVTFNNVGGRGANLDGSVPIASITVDSNVLSSADSRELTIMIGVSGVGGTVRMCDPSITSGPRAC
jgi:type IV fimbrial biogenesis protein FimT